MYLSYRGQPVHLADRGIVAIPLELDWGIDEDVFQVTSDDFEKYSTEVFWI
ncbi:hypothetical protein ACK2IE_21725 [Clostridioides difficile]